MAATYIGAGTQSGNTSTDTTRDIAYPSGIQADDQIVMILAGSSANTMNNPTGWTQLVNTLAGGSSPSLYVGRKTATGTETGNQTVTSAGSAVVQGRMFLIRGVDTSTPLDVAVSVYSNATSANPYAITGVTTTIAGTALIVAGAGNSTTITGTSAVAATAGTLTEVDDRNWRTIASYVLDWSGSGATGNVDLTWSAGSRGAAALIALRPAAGTHQGVAALGATASLTAAGTADAVTTPALAATATLTAAATVDVQAAAALEATAALTAAGAATQHAQADLAATATLQADATVTAHADAALAATATLQATADVLHLGTVTLQALAGLAAQAAVTQLAGATLGAAASLTATGHLKPPTVRNPATVLAPNNAGLTLAGNDTALAMRSTSTELHLA